MRRGLTGNYETTEIAGEKIRAFIPYPLPPQPPLELTAQRQQLLERATLALGRLDSVTLLLPDPDLFLYAYVRREAVLSSQIEGTQSSLAQLLLFELEEAPGAPVDDVVEVSNYVAALDHGLKRLQEGFPLSNRLIREMHAIARNLRANFAARRTGLGAPGQAMRTLCRLRLSMSRIACPLWSASFTGKSIPIPPLSKPRWLMSNSRPSILSWMATGGLDAC